MVRLMLTLTPIVCVLASIVFSQSFDNFLADGEPEGIPPTSPQESITEEPPPAIGGTKKGKKGKKKAEEKVRDGTLGEVGGGCVARGYCNKVHTLCAVE